MAAVLPLYGVWAAFFATGGGDLAAQHAWAGFFARHPDVPYGMFWFGGAHVANYSVLSSPLTALFGVRTVAVLAGVSATWLFAVLRWRATGRAQVWPALIGALGLWRNIAQGRPGSPQEPRARSSPLSAARWPGCSSWSRVPSRHCPGSTARASSSLLRPSQSSGRRPRSSPFTVNSPRRPAV
ncbi:hypothetical protein [Streptomyces sp. NPDC050263]|uniref:hypothetical protein n=1 Tax=Streptomyces sp. NPDC050263 TaxID=3155037 RepID=UPI0034240959